MDIQNLVAFCAVADTGSFSEAARSLHLTQPAVSKRVANLEQQLDCALFDRIGRAVELTDEGKVLLPRARSLLQTLEDSRQALIDLQGEVSGQLRLACSHHIALHRLPGILKSYRNRYPKVDIQLAFMDSEAAYEEILHGRHHLALVTLPAAPQTDLVAELWWPDPLVFTCAIDHPIVQSKLVTLADLQQYPALLPDPDSHTSQQVMHHFTASGLNPALAHTTKSLDALRMLTEAGMGWSVLPRTLLSPQLVEIPLHPPFPRLQRKLGSIHHKDRSLSRAARAFLDARPQKNTVR